MSRDACRAVHGHEDEVSLDTGEENFNQFWHIVSAACDEDHLTGKTSDQIELNYK